MIGVAWLSCQGFQRTLCVEASVIARDILLVFTLEFLQMQQIVSKWATLRATFITRIAAPQILSGSRVLAGLGGYVSVWLVCLLAGLRKNHLINFHQARFRDMVQA